MEDEKTIFERGSALIRTAATTEKCFQDFAIELLPWPAFSPDTNPIENLRGILARKIYDQVKSSVQFKRRIDYTPVDIEKETLSKFVDRVSNRLIKIIKNKGKSIGYWMKT